MPASRSAAPSQSPRVAVLIEASNAYGRGLLAGIHRHLREHDPWSVFLPEHGRGAPPLERLAGWQGDGVIARVETPAIAALLATLRRAHATPCIDLSAARLLPDLPYVETDDAAIGRAAAAHFLEREFRHFAFVGDGRFRWSTNRRQAFRDALAAHGHAVHAYPDAAVRRSRGRKRAEAAPDDDERVERWLRTLPTPVAVFACYDIRGRQVLEACRRARLDVPDHVAVLGVDDDELLCGLASPPLSSIIPDAIGAGRLAARLLEQLMRGERIDQAEWLLPPLGVATRQSTDVLAIDDDLVVAAVRSIREHACRGIRVADLVRALQVSRRVLENRFVKRLGHTPHEEIARVQFRRVEQLLRETDLPLATVAERCGFRHPEYMTVAFTRRYGLSPSRWRTTCADPGQRARGPRP
jgi:LacI family transcriptional regulator